MNSDLPLLPNLQGFTRALRTAGMPVPADATTLLVEALLLVDLERREDVRAAARSVLVKRSGEIAAFDRVFDEFWSAAGDGSDDDLDLPEGDLRPSRVAEDGTGGDGPVVGTAARLERLESAAEAGTLEDGETVLARYSAAELLGRKDFGEMSADELAEARRLLATMRWNPARRRSRRLRSHGGREPDLRRTLREAVRSGGEPLQIARRGRKLKDRPLVVLCDISGSMDRYTRLLLHFLHTVRLGTPRAEVFVFGTRLTRITSALRHRDADSAISAAAEEVVDWSGGTRIGESLGAFNRRWARRVMGHGAVVLIISDGWDRGDPDLLAREMARLQRTSFRLVWLNPLLGVEDYRPLTRGLQAALPYVDDFLSVHSLESLGDLAGVLAELPQGRPRGF